MNKLGQKITFKVLLSYLALASLVIVVGGIIYREVSSFTRAQQEDLTEKTKILQIGKLLTMLYESESFARAAIQSRSTAPLEQFLQKNDSIVQSLDTLQSSIPNEEQSAMLDSIKLLLQQKTQNIRELRTLRQNDQSEKVLQMAIDKLSGIEAKLGRLTLQDFSENPDNLNPEVRKTLDEAISIWNSYIPRDSTNSVDQRTLDSIVTASRTMLEGIRRANSRQKLNVAIKENQVLTNDLTTSQQLRRILTQFETEFLESSAKTAREREQVLSRSIRAVTIAALIAGILMLFFSIIILSDFWKNQQYREALERSNELTKSLLKSREQLISMVSHDLRSPLSTIIGYLELLRGSGLDKKQEYYTERMQTSAGFVTQLVDDLLDFSRLESGKITIERIPFRLDKLLKETAEATRSIHPKKPVDLSIKAEEVFMTPILSDPFRIRQILSNLLGNAFKFTDEGMVTVSVKEGIRNDKKVALISVADTGIGISREKQELIFEEFTQATEDIEKKYGGTGLGLTISRKLANLLGGYLELESEPGKGSTFTLVLPLEFSSAMDAVQLPVTEKLKGQTRTVMIIDDDEELLHLSTIYLKNQGYSVLESTSATEALQLLETHVPEIVITDIQLPGMNGFHFVEKLRSVKEGAFRDIPVIAVSGRRDLDEAMYLSAGFSGFLLKPYQPSQLQNLIHLVLSSEAEPERTVVLEPSGNTKRSVSFNLESLYAFLGQDKEAAWQVLRSFEETTRQDMKDLYRFIKEDNLIEVSQLAHRMQTMFRQIKAEQPASLLQQMEALYNDDTDRARSLYKSLKPLVRQLFKDIEAERKKLDIS